MTASTAAVLREARALVAAPERWTQGTCARTRDGTPCGAGDGAAARWCPDGALRRAAFRGKARLSAPQRASRIEAYGHALAALERATGAQIVPVWNDRPGRLHAEVTSAFSRAIAATEKKGGGDGTR